MFAAARRTRASGGAEGLPARPSSNMARFRCLMTGRSKGAGTNLWCQAACQFGVEHDRRYRPSPGSVARPAEHGPHTSPAITQGHQRAGFSGNRKVRSLPEDPSRGLPFGGATARSVPAGHARAPRSTSATVCRRSAADGSRSPGGRGGGGEAIAAEHRAGPMRMAMSTEWQSAGQEHRRLCIRPRSAWGRCRRRSAHCR